MHGGVDASEDDGEGVPCKDETQVCEGLLGKCWFGSLRDKRCAIVARGGKVRGFCCWREDVVRKHVNVSK